MVESEPKAGAPRLLRRSRRERVVAGHVGSFELILGGTLLALGVVLLLDLAIPHFGKYVWPIALITTGVAVIVEASRRR